jgi:hypothetical protein
MLRREGEANGWEPPLEVSAECRPVECRRNRTKRVDRHGTARYSRALIFVSGEECAGS